MHDIDNYMTIAEAADRFDIQQSTLKERLSGRTKQGAYDVELLKQRGLIKHYKKQGATRGEWIVTTDAMRFWGYVEK